MVTEIAERLNLRQRAGEYSNKLDALQLPKEMKLLLGNPRKTET